jgi:hypothetical protein
MTFKTTDNKATQYRPAFQGFASDGPSIMPLDRLQVILAIYCLTVPEKLY